ncbi:hypothetical protein [[Kitasatospora] papulosa]
MTNVRTTLERYRAPVRERSSTPGPGPARRCGSAAGRGSSTCWWLW